MYDAPDKIAYGKLVLSFTRDLLNGVPMFGRNYSLMPFPFSWNFTEDRYYEYKARKKKLVVFNEGVVFATSQSEADNNQSLQGV